MIQREAGILLHPTSLPGKHGIGDLGIEAYQFIDFLVKSGMNLWQVCPLGPTSFGDSPYQCLSAFAGNPNLINLDKLVEQGLLLPEEIELETPFSEDHVEFGNVIEYKKIRFTYAFDRFVKNSSLTVQRKFESFVHKNQLWLDDYTLFMAVKSHFGGESWEKWPWEIKSRQPEAIKDMKESLQYDILFHTFLQYLFHDQWSELKAYANRYGIKIIGDIPIFVAFDSADAWGKSNLFDFDEKLQPNNVAGVPPDYFSETGQLWGNPLYNWEKMKTNHFSWWKERFRNALDYYDLIRLDHFRGFEAFWQVKAGEPTAMNGKWVKAPGKELFRALVDEFGEIPIIAEDLGLITEEVEELRKEFGFPGMKILQFAFSDTPQNAYLLHNCERNYIIYTGTHDNDTTEGWYSTATDKEKDMVRKYLNVSGSDMAWDMIKAAFSSVCIKAIVPLQDIMKLGSQTRMNTPGKGEGNWGWRFKKEQINDEMAEGLYQASLLYGRI